MRVRDEFVKIILLDSCFMLEALHLEEQTDYLFKSEQVDQWCSTRHDISWEPASVFCSWKTI